MKNTATKKFTSWELSYFCTQVAMILKSGMLISDGIDWMYNDIEEGNIKNALEILKDELSNKVPLYKAMENSGFFPSYVVNMCQIGNATGSLDDVMYSLSEYYEREGFLKTKIKNSLFYPSMLFVMMSFVIIVLVTKIFPIFEDMINELGGQLPGESSFIMSFSAGIMTGKFVLAFVVIILILLVASYIISRTKNGKLSLIKLFGSIKFLKSIINKITAYRFALSMSLLLSSGMNIESSILLLLDITEDETLKNKIKQCSNSMESGEDFLESVSKLSLFSSMHLQMMNMGQRVGELDVVMKKLTLTYEQEADQSINNAVSLIEPILVGTLCVVIGFILISVMLPLMNIMSSIG